MSTIPSVTKKRKERIAKEELAGQRKGPISQIPGGPIAEEITKQAPDVTGQYKSNKPATNFMELQQGQPSPKELLYAQPPVMPQTPPGQALDTKGQPMGPGSSGSAAPITAEDITNTATLGAGGLVKNAVFGAEQIAAKKVGTELLINLAKKAKAPPKLFLQKGMSGAKASAGLIKENLDSAGMYGKFAINSKTEKLTTLFMGALGWKSIATATVIGAIGSYPFSGFLKEEALQSIGYRSERSLNNGDLEGAERQLELEREILEPDKWNRLLNNIPYLNIANNLKYVFQAGYESLISKEIRLEKLKEKETKKAEDIKNKRPTQMKNQTTGLWENV